MYGLTDPFASGKPFNLDDNPRTVEDGTEEIPIWVTAHLKDKAWDQYCDPDIYDADKRIRKWAAESRKEIKSWTHINKYRKFAMYQMFEILYGRPYDGQKDSAFGGKFRNLMNYYASSIQKYTYDSKTDTCKNRHCYTLSPKRLSGPPYSLKLRHEWLLENGRVPNHANMQLPRKHLEPGHSRNKKTEDNMRRRSEKAKEKYLAYQKQYRDEHKSSKKKDS